MKNAILNLATSALYIHENTVYLQQKSPYSQVDKKEKSRKEPEISKSSQQHMKDQITM